MRKWGSERKSFIFFFFIQWNKRRNYNHGTGWTLKNDDWKIWERESNQGIMRVLRKKDGCGE